jgi:hypothetical protein
MFRPDPSGELSVDEVVADLTALLADVPPDSPRALKLAEIIRGLRGEDDRGAQQPRWLRGVRVVE